MTIILFQVFGWTDSTIMQFALWGCLDFPIFFLPAAALLTYSLRGSVVFSSLSAFVTMIIKILLNANQNGMRVHGN